MSARVVDDVVDLFFVVVGAGMNGKVLRIKYGTAQFATIFDR